MTQLETMDDYFKRLLAKNKMTPRQHLQASLVWSAAYIIGLPTPQLTSVVGVLCMEWKGDRTHLIFEFIDGCDVEWCYTDLDRGGYDGDVLDADDYVVLDYMMRF